MVCECELRKERREDGLSTRMKLKAVLPTTTFPHTLIPFFVVQDVPEGNSDVGAHLHASMENPDWLY